MRSSLFLLAFVALLAVANDGGEREAVLAKIPAKAPETVAELVRRYAMHVGHVQTAPAEDSDLRNGYQRGDVIVTAYVDRESMLSVPCGFHERAGGGVAEFVKRKGAWLPQTDLARWMRSGVCPPR
jgi:hypothetical protein